MISRFSRLKNATVSDRKLFNLKVNWNDVSRGSVCRDLSVKSNSPDKINAKIIKGYPSNRM